MAACERAIHLEVLTMKIKQSSHTKRLTIRHPRRVIIISAIALLAVAIGIYAFMSYQNWNELQKRSGEASASLKSDIEDSLGAKESDTSVATQIDAIVTDFERKNGENPCQSPRLYSWQTVLPALKNNQSTCEEKITAARETIAALKPLSTFLKDQTKATAAVSATIEATKAPTDFTAASASWKALATSADLSQTSEFKPISISIIASSELIANAYTALAVASKAEDRTAYDEAIEKLKVAYGTLVTVSASSKVEQTRLVNAAVAAYETL